MARALLLGLVAAATACAPAVATEDPALVPPVFGDAVIDPWLTAGYYQHWTCEAAPHVSAAPSPHGQVRTCHNPIAEAAGAAPDWPVDSAWVTELDDGTGTVIGHAVQRRSEADPGGASWYWYLDANGTVSADGWGFEGPARDVCAACHAAAGSGSNAGHGFVF